MFSVCVVPIMIVLLCALYVTIILTFTICLFTIVSVPWLSVSYCLCHADCIMSWLSSLCWLYHAVCDIRTVSLLGLSAVRWICRTVIGGRTLYISTNCTYFCQSQVRLKPKQCLDGFIFTL